MWNGIDRIASEGLCKIQRRHFAKAKNCLSSPILQQAQPRGHFALCFQPVHLLLDGPIAAMNLRHSKPDEVQQSGTQMCIASGSITRRSFFSSLRNLGWNRSRQFFQRENHFSFVYGRDNPPLIGLVFLTTDHGSLMGKITHLGIKSNME
jgi:hypothetical protein